MKRKTPGDTVLLLDIFEKAGLLFSELEKDTTEKKLKLAFNYRLAQVTNIRAKDFLSVQADMLIRSRQLNEKGVLDAFFEGVVIRQEADPTDSSIVGYYISKKGDYENKIVLGLTGTLGMGALLAHEMTHALDDIYDNRHSGERVRAVLQRHEDGEFQKQAILKASQAMPDSISATFVTSYCNNATTCKPEEDLLSFTDACRAKDTGSKVSQAIAASALSLEFASFSYESVFSVLQKTGKVDGFTKAYDRLYTEAHVKMSSEGGAACGSTNSSIVRDVTDPAIGKVAQELLATSMYDINEHMIDIAPKGQELLVELRKIKASIEPAYMRSTEYLIEYYKNEIIAINAQEAPDTDHITALKKSAKKVIKRITEYSRAHAHPYDTIAVKAAMHWAAIQKVAEIGTLEAERGVVAAAAPVSAGSPSLTNGQDAAPASAHFTSESSTPANREEASAVSAPMTSAASFTDFPRLTRQVDDSAIRMRAVLTKIEAESGGKVKYGDLKRTISPVRSRPGRN